MKTNRLALLSLMITVTSVVAFGGTKDGGGVDDYKYGYGSAWFVGGSKTIQGCYEIAPDFGFNGDQVKSAILNAFSSWRTYMQTRSVDVDSVISVSTKISLTEGCVGSEDIRFVFGSLDSEVSRYKSLYDHPFAFAQRTQYDPKLGWGKGLVWIAPNGTVEPGVPNWDPTSDRLPGVLMHEVGHVLGCEHLEGTVMDANYSIYLKAFTDYQRLLQIDQDRELISCSDCETRYQPMSGYALAPAFQKLTGITPVGTVDANYRSTSKNSSTGTLTYTDQTGSFDFQTQVQSIVFLHSDNAKLFSTTLDSSSSAFFGNPGGYYNSSTEMALGTIKDKNGNVRQCVFEFNAGDNEAFSVRLTDDQNNSIIVFQSFNMFIPSTGG